MKYIKNYQYRVIIFILIIAILGSSFLYIMYFNNALKNNISNNVNFFTRIIIPDTFLYKNLVENIIDNNDNIIISLIFSTVKNTLGPSLVWYLSSFNWYIVSIFNALIIILIVKYIILLSNYFKLTNFHKQIIIISFLIMPSTLYYSIGSLKELPTSLFLMGSIYHFLKKENFKFLLFIFFLILYRYQMVALIPMLYLTKFIKKNIFRKYVLLLLFLMAIYPFINNITIFYNNTTELYREQFGSIYSIGGIVENIRDNIPIFSIFAICFRTFQSLFEPIIVFSRNMSFFENGYFSIINFQYLISNVIMIPFIIIFFKKALFIFIKGKLINKQIQIIFSVVFLFIVLVGGFSFIHHRYLYPFFPLLMISSLIQIINYRT